MFNVIQYSAPNPRPNGNRCQYLFNGQPLKTIAYKLLQYRVVSPRTLIHSQPLALLRTAVINPIESQSFNLCPLSLVFKMTSLSAFGLSIVNFFCLLWTSFVGLLGFKEKPAVPSQDIESGITLTDTHKQPATEKGTPPFSLSISLA